MRSFFGTSFRHTGFGLSNSGPIKNQSQNTGPRMLNSRAAQTCLKTTISNPSTRKLSLRVTPLAESLNGGSLESLLAVLTYHELARQVGGVGV